MKSFGGNSGYIDYSISKRGSRAKKEGRYPKTEFCKEYGISPKDFKLAQLLGIITTSEWHHTSKYGNRTPFFELEDEFIAFLLVINEKKYNDMIEYFEGEESDLNDYKSSSIDRLNKRREHALEEVENLSKAIEGMSEDNSMKNAMLESLKELKNRTSKMKQY